MPAKNQSDRAARDILVNATRQFTRSTLLLQSAIANKAGLNVTDAECIDFLMEMGPSSAGDLARATMLTTGAITSVIDRLEKAGMVRREKDELDRRKVIVRFLPERHKQTHQFYSALSGDVQALISTYTPHEVAFLTRHMQAMKAIFDRNTLLVSDSPESAGSKTKL